MHRWVFEICLLSLVMIRLKSKFASVEAELLLTQEALETE
jgi:hypothetical protein